MLRRHQHCRTPRVACSRDTSAARFGWLIAAYFGDPCVDGSELREGRARWAYYYRLIVVILRALGPWWWWALARTATGRTRAMLEFARARV